MGIYLNPGKTALEDDRLNPYYVDKSMLIRELNAMIDVRYLVNEQGCSCKCLG